MPTPNDLRVELDSLCKLAPRSGQDVEARHRLIWDVYQYLHCRMTPETMLWSNREQNVVNLARARNRLSPHPVRHGGWAGWVDGRAALRDHMGIEVIPPPGALIEETSNGLVLVTPSLTLSPDGRWMAWRSRKLLPSSGVMRLYVNANATSAVDVWLAAASALAGTELTCQTKVAPSLQLADRADCLVVYARCDDLPDVISVIRESVDPTLLDTDVPGFAYQIAAGMAIGLPGDDDSPQVSTGMMWSTRVVDAFYAGPNQVDEEFERLGAVRRRVAAEFGTVGASA